MSQLTQGPVVKPIKVSKGRLSREASTAIENIVDAAVELVTNADDEYERMAHAGVLDGKGCIEIEVQRRKLERPSTFRVRDFGRGMTVNEMELKLGVTGGSVSGMAEGQDVRGSESRGAKDVSTLGMVTFESIARSDGRYHKCVITPDFDIWLYDSEAATPVLRSTLGIPDGESGLIVTIDIDPSHPIPAHANLAKKISRLVSLRHVLRDRDVFLKDLGTRKAEKLDPPVQRGKERFSESFAIEGYPEATAKLKIYRASRPFEQGEKARFRLGGILVKSRRAIHEATLFDGALDRDPHALWFYGTLVCPYIDQLNTEFYITARNKSNPRAIIDPARKTGLTKDHPFTKALFAEARKHLRPLIEKERERVESDRSKIENSATRRRLNAVEKAVTKFMEEHLREGTGRDGRNDSLELAKNGFVLSPPFAQIIKGHSIRCSFKLSQEMYPQVETGENVQVHCLSDEISVDKKFAPLKQSETVEGMLIANWSVKAHEATSATGIRTRVGPIIADATFEIFESDAERFAHVDRLMFQRNRYTVKSGKGSKKIRIFAPLSMVDGPTPVAVSVSSSAFSVVGKPILEPREDWGIAVCELSLKAKNEGGKGHRNSDGR